MTTELSLPAFYVEQEMQRQLEYATADPRSRRSSLSSAPRELDGQSSECLVCLETTGLDARPCCGEPVCLSCLAQHVKSKLDDGIVRIGCPNPECASFVQVDHELEIVDPELVAVYYRRLVDANSDPRRKTCPNCCLITEFEPSTLSDRKSRAKYGLLVECSECRFRWCFRCHGPEHPGLKCSKNLAADDQLKKWAKHRSAENNAPAAQRCPSCKVIHLLVCLFITSTKEGCYDFRRRLFVCLFLSRITQKLR